MPNDIYDALGLKGNPFSPATSTRGYFHTQATQRILEEVNFGISHRRGFLLLIGEVGVGKTSLLLQLLERIHSDPNESLRSAWIFNSMMDRTELLRAIAMDFGLNPDRDATFAELLSQLHQFFLKVNSSGGNCAIIIDEAHNFDVPTLESLRLLSNLESDEKKLVQILLSGQPELQIRLNHNELRQLRSRIAISNVLPALDKAEVKRYVDFKLSSTSSQLYLPGSSCSLLHRATKGNVRLINLIMERSLHAMFALDQKSIHPRIVHAAVRDVATFQQDIKHNYYFRTKVVLAGIVCVLILSGIYIYQGAPFFSSFGHDRTVQQQSKENSAFQSTIHRSSIPVDHDSLLQIMPDASLTRKDLEAFLAPFGLEEKVDVMLEALWVNSPEVLQAKLPEKLMLSRLKNLPEDSGLDYSAFAWEKYTGRQPAWIVLWQPPIEVKGFYPESMSPEIRKLQERLQEKGFYRSIADGYLGSATWQALIDFQSEFGLDRTGTPTPETVFWLFSGASPPKP